MNPLAERACFSQVPKGWTEDKPLGLWVKRQRTLKKALDRGEPCQGMAAARAAKLEALGFAWELSAAAIRKQHSKGNAGGKYNAGWEAQSAKLKAYKRKHGDCNVPQAWAEDPPFGRWVGTQRKFKRALDRGEPSLGMTAARAAKLDALGFAWELSAKYRKRDDAGWEGWLAKLKAYKQQHGDCNVPQGWTEDKPLGQWVSRQRHGKKALDRAEPYSKGMTAARAAKLEALAFAWAPSRE